MTGGVCHRESYRLLFGQWKGSRRFGGGPRGNGVSNWHGTKSRNRYIVEDEQVLLVLGGAMRGDMKIEFVLH